MWVRIPLTSFFVVVFFLLSYFFTDSVTCMLFIFLFIIDILFTYFVSDLDIDSKQVVYICFKILLEE